MMAVALSVVAACSKGTPSWIFDPGPASAVPGAKRTEPGTSESNRAETSADAGVTGGPDSTADGGSAGGSAPEAPGPVVVPADGGTLVRGTLSGMLTAAGSPYRVVGDAQNVVTIPKGQTLTVGPGVILDFVGSPEVTEADTSGDEVMHHQAGRVELRVYGRIVVQGAPGNLAVLTSTNPYGWWGINFFGNESVGDGHPVFDHMLFEKVRKNEHNGTRQFTRGAIWAFYPGGPLTLTHSVLRDNVSSAKCGAIDLMYTSGSLIEGNLFENNRTSEIDRFAQDGSQSTSGGGAMCITHGRNSQVRGNRFKGNLLESSRGLRPASLTARPFLTWPNPSSQYDLGGGGAIHYFQPDGDLVEGNLFEDNGVRMGPGAAIYVEDVPTRGVTLRGNEFRNNRAGSGGVIVCNRGAGNPQVVFEADNRFAGNTVEGATAAELAGDCRR